MDKKLKQERLQAIDDSLLDQVTGGADFARYIGYVITYNDCRHKWEEATVKPKRCEKCQSTNISVYSPNE